MKLKLSTLGITAGLFIAAAVTVGSAKAQTTNTLTITNASFEAPAVASGTTSIYVIGAGTDHSVTGWTANVSSGVWAQHNNNPAMSGGSGSQYVESFAIPGSYNGNMVVFQTLAYNFKAGYTYNFTALAGVGSGAAMQSGDFFSIDNSGLTSLASTSITNSGTGTGAFVPYTTSYVAQPGDASSAIVVAFNGVGQSGGNKAIYLDNFTITEVVPVPEPSTWALFGVAMACGIVARHSFRRRQA